VLGPAATQAPGILLRKCSSTTLHDTTTASSNANTHMISRPDTPVSADCTQPQYREQKYARGSTSSHSWRRPGSSHLSQACSLTSDASPGAQGHAKRLQDRQILREHQCDGRFSAIMSFPCGKFNLTPTPALSHQVANPKHPTKWSIQVIAVCDLAHSAATHYRPCHPLAQPHSTEQ